jgi:hypothetical protein
MSPWEHLKERWPLGRRGRERRRTLAANLALRDRHRGQRCFILATGPSIKSQDLRQLRGEVAITVSNFFVHPDAAHIAPRYHCVPPYHPPIKEEAWQQWLAEMAAATSQATMLFGLSDHERNQRGGHFRNRARHFVDFSGSWDQVAAKGVDLTAPLPSPQSVTIMALYAALYMGFAEIYLLGCDHDWILHVNESTHFYEERQHALVRDSYNEWFGGDFGAYCEDYVRLWQQYRALRAVAQRQSVRIRNATRGGLLDVFERVDYQKIIASRHPQG